MLGERRAANISLESERTARHRNWSESSRL